MAKKVRAKLNDNLFSDTTVTAVEGTSEVDIPAEGRTVPVGVGLKESELALIDSIAKEYGIARNALMRWALRHFLKQHLNGDVSLADSVEVPKTKNKLKMP